MRSAIAGCAAFAVIAALASFPVIAAAAPEEIQAELSDAMFVCGVRCDSISLQVRILNRSDKPICIPSSDLKFLPGQLTLVTPDGPANSYNGGSGPPPPAQVAAHSFDFPVYFINPGKTLVVRSSGNSFFDIARNEVTLVTLSFRSFVCGERASALEPFRPHAASASVRYEDAYDAPGVDLPEPRQ